MIGSAVRVAISCRPALAIAVQHGAKFFATQIAAVANKLRPWLRQVEIDDGFARQAEGKIESGDPRPRPAQPGLEILPGGKFFEAFEKKQTRVERDRWRW